MKNVHLLPTDRPSRLYKQTGALVLDKLLEVSNDGISINQHIYITSDASDEEIKVGDWVIAIEGIWKNTITKITGTPITDVWMKIILTTDPDLLGVQSIDNEFLEWFVKNPSCEWVEYIVEYKDGYGNWYRYDKEFWDKNSDKPIFSTRYKIIIPQEEPKQYPIGGYAPGYYSCTCVTCKTEFMGDKRAVQCEPCAIEMVSIKIVENNGSYQIEKPKQETLEEAADRLAKKYGYEIEGGKVADFVDGVVRGAEWQAERTPSIIEEYLETAFISKEQGYMNPQKWFEQFKKK